MGSCSGTVAFGVAVEEEERLPFPWPPELQEELEFTDDDDPIDLGAYLALRSGAVDPCEDPGPGYDKWRGWPEGQEPADWEERLERWRSAKQKVEEEAPVEILLLGHYEGTPLYIVALKGTEISTLYSNEAKELVLPTIDQSQIEAAADFCKDNDICPFEDPKWLLGSSLG